MPLKTDLTSLPPLLTPSLRRPSFFLSLSLSFSGCSTPAHLLVALSLCLTYQDGNAYIEANPAWSTMALSGGVSAG